MGEAKRRKVLDPNYGKPPYFDAAKEGLKLFPEKILNDYFRFRMATAKYYYDLSKLTSSNRDPQIERFESALKDKFDVFQLEKYIDQLEESMATEFTLFLNYILTTRMGTILFEELENMEDDTGKPTPIEESVIALWPVFLAASASLNVKQSRSRGFGTSKVAV